VPNEWKDAAFHKLLAEGAFEVSALRRGGKTRFVQLTSRAGAPCRIHTSLEEPVIASGKRAFKLTAETDRNGQRISTIDLRKGETVLLMSASEKLSPDNLVIEPVAAQEDRLNFYGSPKGGKNNTREK
jgi:hypothetical protein